MARTKKQARNLRKRLAPEPEAAEATDHSEDNPVVPVAKRVSVVESDKEEVQNLTSVEHQKPSMSFSQLIREVIQKSPHHRLLLHEIYDSIQRDYPYFKGAGEGWKNSVRHNLSINSQFCKIPKALVDDPVAAALPNAKIKRKGCYWMLKGQAEMNEDKMRLMHERRRKSLSQYFAAGTAKSLVTSDDSDVIRILPFTQVNSLRRASAPQPPALYPSLLQEPLIRPLPYQSIPIVEIQPLPLDADQQIMPWLATSPSLVPTPIQEEAYSRFYPGYFPASAKTKHVPCREERDPVTFTEGPPQSLPRRDLKDVWLGEETTGSPSTNFRY